MQSKREDKRVINFTSNKLSRLQFSHLTDVPPLPEASFPLLFIFCSFFMRHSHTLYSLAKTINYDVRKWLIIAYALISKILRSRDTLYGTPDVNRDTYFIILRQKISTKLWLARYFGNCFEFHVIDLDICNLHIVLHVKILKINC